MLQIVGAHIFIQRYFTFMFRCVETRSPYVTVKTAEGNRKDMVSISADGDRYGDRFTVTDVRIR